MIKQILTLSLLTATLVACSPKSEQATETETASQTSNSLIERINHKGVISVGTEGTYAPFTYHDEQGNLTGYDVEVTRAVAKKIGVTVDFKETQWDAMLAGLKAGRFDMVANQVSLTTPERQATFDKSANYSYSGPMAVTRAGEHKFHDLKEIKGLKAAQTLSSNYGEMATEYGAEVVPIDGMAQGLTLIQQKRADLTLNDSLALLDYLKKNPNSGLDVAWRSGSADKLGSGFIINKGNTEALEKISQAVEELRADGTLKKLGIQFFGEDISQP